MNNEMMKREMKEAIAAGERALSCSIENIRCQRTGVRCNFKSGADFE